MSLCVVGVPESEDTDVLLCVVGVPESEDTDVLFCCCWLTRQLCEKLTVGEDIDGELQSLKMESEQFSTLLDEVRSISSSGPDFLFLFSEKE